MPEPIADGVPAYLGIEITRRCNLRCPHCFTASGRDAEPGPDAAVVAALFPDLVAAGVRKVAFSGGEPLLRTDLEAIMARGRDAGVEAWGVVTNGTLVTGERARSLARAGLSIAQVSLDGVDARDHAAVRACRPRDFYRAVRGVRLLREAGIRVDVACLLTPRNLERADEMALFCEALGATLLRWCTYVPTGRGAAPEVAARSTPAPDRLDTFLAFLRSMNAHPGRPVGLTIDHGIGPWNDTLSFACSSGRDVAYIAADGGLYPCPGLIFPPFRVGDAYREPIGALLRSPAMSAVRALCKTGLAGPCATCDHAACTGGCRGLAYALHGDVRGAVPYCHVARRRQGA